MATHNVGSINPNYPSFDHPPVANADSASVAYNAQVTIAALANDTDVDTADQGYLGVGRYTDPVLPNGQLAGGTLQVINNRFVFTASDPNFANGATKVTFTYTAVDQWGAESNWTTVTINVTGNATPGKVLHAGWGSLTLSDTAGNDTLYGGVGSQTLVSTLGADKLYGGVGNQTLIAGSGNDLLVGGIGSSTLIAGTGADILTGGEGTNLFVLPSGFTKVTITNFGDDDGWRGDDRGWGGWSRQPADRIQISPWVFKTFADMMAHATQQGHDVVISSVDAFNPALVHTLTLQGVHLSDLHPNAFLFQ